MPFLPWALPCKDCGILYGDRFTVIGEEVQRCEICHKREIVAIALRLARK